MESFDTGQGYLKAGLLGFPKSGKTYTAVLMADAVRKHFQLTAPIALFDTEAGGVYVNPLVKELTGQSIIGTKSRALSDLMKMAAECESGQGSVLIVDSITHVWREVCDAYLKQINDVRKSQGKPTRTRLEFQDWASIKAKWNEWTTFYLNSKLHIIICGRAGFEWDFEEKEDARGNVHKELIKTGVKMKVESEFGFEPSLLALMERENVLDDATGKQTGINHNILVLGDRFQVLDGKMCTNPTGAFFMPHIRLLTPGADNTVDTEPHTPHDVDEAGDTEFKRQRRLREIALEEIEGVMVQTWPGQSAAEKKAKVDALDIVFKTRAWAKVKSLPIAELQSGLERMKAHAASAATAKE